MNTSNNILKEALIQVTDEELDALETEASKELHVFSDDYYNKMETIIELSKHKYTKAFGHNIRRSSLVAIVVALILCMTVSVYAIVKEIPLSFSQQDDSWGVMIESSNGSSSKKDFKYILPKTPDGFQVEEKNEGSLSLHIAYIGPSNESILYSQVFGGDGKAEMNVPHSGDNEVYEEKINDRSAIIAHLPGNISYIMIEDGINVFLIQGTCDYAILYEMALDVTSKY